MNSALTVSIAICFCLLADLLQSQYIHPNLCISDMCVCMKPDALLDCNHKDAIPGIPINIPEGIKNIVIQSGVFPAPGIIRRQNLSSLSQLQIIRIISSQVRGIESNAFADMVELKVLDLAKNNIREIQPDTFVNLRLDMLRLDSNYGIQLHDDSFRQLKVKTLTLRSCGIISLSRALLANMEFQQLNLFNNSIRSLDPSIASILQPPLTSLIRTIDLSQNPLHCSCDMSWLGEHIRKQTLKDDTREDISVTCGSPSSLKGLPVALLRMDDLQCYRPMIREITIDLSATMAKLTCTVEATQKPEVHLGYLRDTVRHENYRPGSDRNGGVTLDSISTNKIVEKNSVDLNVSLHNKPSEFYCLAGKRDGADGEKVELKILLSSQLSLLSLTNSSSGASSGKTYDQNSASLVNPDARFTLLELLLAVLGTFVFTICLTFLAFRLSSRYCSGRGPWGSGSCSSSQGGSTYSTVKCPLSSQKASQQHHNNNTINMLNSSMHKSMMAGPLLSNTTGTSSDYDVPQYNNGHPGMLPYQPPLAYPPGMGYQYPHSRTMSSLRLESMEPQPPGQSIKTSFLDFKTQQEISSSGPGSAGAAMLWTPPPAPVTVAPLNMINSTSQPHALHSSQRNFIT